MSRDKTLKHIAFIMDGNGRWAKARDLNRLEGHKKGTERLREIIQACADNNIEQATFYAFSSENWKRPEDEVTGLMGLFKIFFNREIKSLKEQGVRLKFLGDYSDKSKVPADIKKIIKSAEDETANNTKITVNICFNYGSREEILNATKQIATDFKAGNLNLDDLTEDKFADYLYSKETAEVDLMVRTSGEVRLSNFLLWQLSYAEMVFTDCFWPDFDSEKLNNIIDDFHGRERRFGGLAS